MQSMSRFSCNQSFVRSRVGRMRVSECDGECEISTNVNYEKDVRYATNLICWVLSSIGLWPDGLFKVPPIILIVLGNSALAFAVVPCVFHLVYEETNRTIWLKLFGLLIFCSGNAVKYGALTFHRPTIRYCIDHVKRDWRQVNNAIDRDVMIKYAKTGRKLSIVSFSFMYTSGVVYHTILPFMANKVVDDRNLTIKPLVYPTYSGLFNAQRRPVYEFVFLAHCMCGYMIYTITCGACTIAAIFAMHGCGQIEILMSWLDNLVSLTKKCSVSDMNRHLGCIVEYHLQTLRFLTMVKIILQEVCLAEFISSSIVICLLEYYCITDWRAHDTLGLTTYTFLLVSILFNIFLLCYIGELLVEQSDKIGVKCYTIQWYKLSPKTARGLLIILAISSNPIKLAAGKMVYLCLSTFGNMVKTSLVYLSYLQGMGT